MTAGIGSLACEPLSVFHYLYAVAYSPTYRTRFAEQLRQGFPRFPLPASRESFFRLSEFGGRLVALHTGSKACDDDSTVDADVFRLGGYDVLKRRAKPRMKHKLTACDDRETARLAWIGRETARWMAAIDEAAAGYFSGAPQPPPPGVSIVKTSPGWTST
jgi:hypothetical protein